MLNLKWLTQVLIAKKKALKYQALACIFTQLLWQVSAAVNVLLSVSELVKFK